MEVQVAETGPCSRSLHITVPPHSVDEHLDQMMRSAQQQVQLRGFRPGKVPRALLEKKFGKDLLAEAKEQLLNRFFGEACRERELNPVGRIAIDGFEQIEIKRGAQLQFTAKIDIKPTFELGELKGLEVDAFEAEANDADVQKALEEIAHQRRSIRPTTEPAADGDFLKCDYSFHDESGKQVHERKGVQLNTRIPIHGTEEAAYQAALIGAEAGRQLEVPIQFPDNFEKTEVRGQKGTVKIAVHEVLRVVPPPIDEEFAKALEFENLEQLQNELRQRIGAEKRRLGRARQEEQCLDHLLRSHEIALPPSLVEEQKRASLGQFAQRLQEAGTEAEELQKKLLEADPEAQQDAERRVRLFFLFEAIARQQKLFVTETDLDNELRAIAMANSGPEQQITAAQVREHLEGQNRLGELRLALLERKVRDFLRENARAVDKTGG